MRKRFIVVMLVFSLLSFYLPSPNLVQAADLPKPVQIQDISYTYQPHVKLLNFAPATRLGNTLVWPNSNFQPGDLLVDESLQSSVKILHKLESGAYLITSPSIYDLFREFNLPRQVIVPNQANITEFDVKGYCKHGAFPVEMGGTFERYPRYR